MLASRAPASPPHPAAGRPPSGPSANTFPLRADGAAPTMAASVSGRSSPYRVLLAWLRPRVTVTSYVTWMVSSNGAPNSAERKMVWWPGQSGGNMA